MKSLLPGWRRVLLRDHPANAKVLVFVHVPKCAGTTLRPIITSHYRRIDVILYYPNGTDVDLNLSKLLNGHAKCYYGHFYMDIDPGKNFLCVSMIRDPVKRIISHYYYIARDSYHWQHRLVIDHGYSLADHALGVDNNNREVDNAQLRQLAGLPGDLAIDEPVFAAARSKILRTYALVGTTENLKDFVSRLSQLMGWRQPVKYENRNVGNYEAVIPQEIVRAIRERNTWDQRLYEELANQ